jgi:hypothetical protein
MATRTAGVVRSANYREVMLTTDQKGAIAESAIVHEAIKLGIGVLRPVNDGLRYDLVLDVDDRLIRVQVKWANFLGDVVAVRAYSCRRTRDGLLKRAYTAEEIDAFAAYSADLNRCYFLPIEEFPDLTHLHLRLAPTKNNQKLGIHWAEQYEFAARLGGPGAVAQLGERLAGSQ